MPVFDIIIPSYNNQKELLKCLEGFSSQTFKDFKIYICIDGSTDDSVETLKNNNFKFEHAILEHADKQNHGRNATRNLAFDFLASDYLLFFDSDITPYPDLVANHFQLLKERPVISVGNVDYLNKQTNLWAGYISQRGYNKFKSFQEMAPEYMNMGNVAMPTIFFKTLHGMDANLKKYGGDDSELAIRLEKTFKPNVINNSSAKGFSILNKTLDFALLQIKEFGAVNLKYIHQKHPGFGHIYAYDVMKGKTLKSIVFRLVMGSSFPFILKRCIPFLPSALRFKVIHILTAFYLYKGFSSRVSE